MQLFNTLTRKLQDFKPLTDGKVRLYSCGPTVYDHIHIGNLSYFVYVDTLRRTLQASGYSVNHIMNVTDVDDKTIHRSHDRYPDENPLSALKKLTQEYEMIFKLDMLAVGNDLSSLTLVKATECIQQMQDLTTRLYKDGFAYIADDGVYFSIEKYRQSGKKYGQLLELQAKNTSAARINNDEYDKESVHDFALWKLQKSDEPAWEFRLDGHDLLGRPGWHIECSAMSVTELGQPFDIHTGGVDLIFPHHENEIAQSTAGLDEAIYANFFIHTEHLLVDGRKMSKSLNNFYTLEDVKERKIDALAFRLLVLQSHYRAPVNFSWENLDAAQNRLKNYYAMADLKWQLVDTPSWFDGSTDKLLGFLKQDLNTPQTLTYLSGLTDLALDKLISRHDIKQFSLFIKSVDNLLSLNMSSRQDISPDQKKLISEREAARNKKDWAKADGVRLELEKQEIGVRDTSHGPIWYRL